jgi:hypothetical protein
MPADPRFQLLQSGGMAALLPAAAPDDPVDLRARAALLSAPSCHSLVTQYFGPNDLQAAAAAETDQLRQGLALAVNAAAEANALIAANPGRVVGTTDPLGYTTYRRVFD